MNPRPGFPVDAGARLASGVFLGLRLVSLLPIPVGIAMLVFTPTYMIHTALGIALLVLGLGFAAGGYGLSAVAIGFLRARRLGIGVLLAFVSVFFCTFPALWLVLLGPAVPLLLKPAQ